MKKPNMKPSPTLLIVLCFVSSAGIRAWEGSVAIASEIASDDGASNIQQSAQNICPEPQDSEELLELIMDRQENLDEFEQTLMDREQVLKVIKIQLEKKLEELEDAEKRLADSLAIADKAAEKDITRLTSVYENMKSKEAAEIFETMDITFAAGFLSRMRPDAAAGILSNVDTKVAYAISVVMAGRNVGAPTQQ